MISELLFEIIEYLDNCGQDPAGWDLIAIADELDAEGFSSIDEVEPDDFTELLMAHEK